MTIALVLSENSRAKNVFVWNTMSPSAPLWIIFLLDLWPWPFTAQNVRLHEIHMHAKYQVAIFNSEKVMANVKVFGQTDRRHILDIWPWRMTLTSTFHHSKCATPWDAHACQLSSCYVKYWKSYDHLSFQTDGQTDILTDWRTVQLLYATLPGTYFF